MDLDVGNNITLNGIGIPKPQWARNGTPREKNLDRQTADFFNPRVFLQVVTVCNIPRLCNIVGAAMASWVVCLTPERALRVRALARDIVLTVLLGKTCYSHGASILAGG